MLFLLLALLFALFILHQFWWRLRNLPKGPLPLPFIGNMHSMWNYNRWEDKLLEWKEQYGPIYTFWLGPMPMVGVNDYKVAVDMFVKDGETYTERVSFEAFNLVTRGGDFGLVDSSGSLWKDQRRFALRVLRDFGLGKNKMQDRILDEVQTIFDNLNRDIDTGIVEHDFHQHTDLATGSVINAIVCGFRYSINNRENEFRRVKRLTEQMFESFSDPLLNTAIRSPFMCKLPVFKQRFDRSVQLFMDFKEFLGKVIDDHVKENDYGQEMEPQDFIDAYLIEMKRAEERNEPHYFTKIQLINTVMDLWFAGQETTSSTITWGLAYLLHQPRIQQRIHAELDQVIGGDRLITVADKSQLPYVNATIMEIQRVANIFSMNLPRKVSKTVEVEGVRIEKGTMIAPQISVMMCDPKIFKDPKEFNPSRYIDSNGQFNASPEVVPFSLGKRQCLGEGLARMELFLFIANILNQYTLLPGKNLPTLKKTVSGASVATEPYKCRVERRF